MMKGGRQLAVRRELCIEVLFRGAPLARFAAPASCGRRAAVASNEYEHDMLRHTMADLAERYSHPTELDTTLIGVT
jgi:hypothetical protein